MNRTVRLAGALAGALLALGLLSAPAGAKPSSDEPVEFTCTTDDSDATTAAAADTADDDGEGRPSGREAKGDDEPAGPGTQGRSNSDPDGMENGGADKPGCPREGDWAEDTDNDGNNGCGNDDDREDDNNGNCGKNREADDGEVAPFGVPDEPAEDPAPAGDPDPVDDPAPVVKAPKPADEDPDPVVDEPPADEEEEGPTVWADEDDADDPDPDEEYPGDSSTPTTVAPGDVPDDPTGSPDMQLAAQRNLARNGGLFALGLVTASGLALGGGRLVLSLARRRLTD
ncbi:MAG: hypothetical protein M3357_02065 [Actinomycetota bacterium]|nr:hypothetical protein [Actinomycetota bacterium]